MFYIMNLGCALSYIIIAGGGNSGNNEGDKKKEFIFLMVIVSLLGLPILCACVCCVMEVFTVGRRNIDNPIVEVNNSNLIYV